MTLQNTRDTLAPEEFALAGSKTGGQKETRENFSRRCRHGGISSLVSMPDLSLTWYKSLLLLGEKSHSLLPPGIGGDPLWLGRMEGSTPYLWGSSRKLP